MLVLHQPNPTKPLKNEVVRLESNESTAGLTTAITSHEPVQM